MDFEWNEAKAASNERKHDASFTEAITVFADPLSITGYDPDHSEGESRYITMGLSAEGGYSWCRIPIATRRYGLSALAKQAVQSEGITRMETSPDESTADDLRPEYDFRALRGAVRGKYAARYRERLRVVRLAEDVAEAFTDEASVNAALREYLRGHPTPATHR